MNRSIFKDTSKAFKATRLSVYLAGAPNTFVEYYMERIRDPNFFTRWGTAADQGDSTKFNHFRTHICTMVPLSGSYEIMEVNRKQATKRQTETSSSKEFLNSEILIEL